MKNFEKKDVLLFLTILIEGYVVLAIELLAMRQLMPFTGSGIEIVSIIISGVLLPMAVGYYAGSQRFKKEYHKKARRFSRKEVVSVRRIILKNIISALLILTFGLSSVILLIFFELLHSAGITYHVFAVFIYSAIFLVFPIYLMAQTIPLVSLYFSHKKLNEMTGKMLCFSTIGSFLGSVFSTIVLMTTIGVNNTVIVTLWLLGMLAMSLTRKWWQFDNLIIVIILGVIAALNSSHTLGELFSVIAETPYNQVSVRSDKDGMLLVLNNSTSSKYAADPAKRYAYIRYMETEFLNPVDPSKPKEILIIGAGGFTFGVDDTTDHFTFVDIEPKLKSISEQYILPHALGANKDFVPMSARLFLNRDQQHYDLIVVDVYNSIHSIPMETITRDFLLKIKERLKPDAILVANIISSPTFADRFSVRYHNTFASVFPVFARQTVTNRAVPLSALKIANNLYIYYNTALASDTAIYTDDRNTYSLDRK